MISDMFLDSMAVFRLVLICALIQQLSFVWCNEIQHPASSLNFLALGDWGGLPIPPFKTDVETHVAQRVNKTAEELKPEFIMAVDAYLDLSQIHLTSGDNFYFLGVENVDDPRFEETFEDVFKYLPLTPWYVCAGNHDHHGNVSAQIAYSEKSHRWKFPDYNYSVTWQIPGSHSSLQLVMIDTIILCGITGSDIEGDQPHGTSFPKQASEQWEWIEETLSRSKADYLLVAGHYPVWSIAEHGPTHCLVEHLKPLLEKYHVTSYVSGHDHNLQHLDDGSGVHYFVTGCANFINDSNDHLKDVPEGSSKFFWADSSKYGGFTTFSVTSTMMNVTFIDSTGASLHNVQLKPRDETY